MTISSLPTVDDLRDALSHPSQAVIDSLARDDGDIMLLGVGGKIGPELAVMARRALDAAGSSARVIGVARSPQQDVVDYLERSNVELVRADLLDDGALAALPDAARIVYLAGRKFGTGGDASTTWALNSYLPGRVMSRFPEARIVGFSTGNVYPLVPASSGGSNERDPVGPVGEYAQSSLGRERIIEHFSRAHGTPAAIVRLNYAVEMRYGVLLELARAVAGGQVIDITTGSVNVVWQGDVNAATLRLFEHASSPPFVLNIAGPETASIAWIAGELGTRLGVEPVLAGEPASTALLSNSARATALFGYPSMPLSHLLDLTAEWVRAGGVQHGKDTHFQERGSLLMAAVLSTRAERILLEGTIIPAHPLALTTDGALDVRRQRALARYYLDAGAGGLAVGVHTTQFGIRSAGLLPRVLQLAAETAHDWRDPHDVPLLVAGVAGDTAAAVAEAELAAELGYDLALVILRDLAHLGEQELLEHLASIGEVIPICGFALQTAVGGRHLSVDFWRSAASLKALRAIKIAPFDRYRTNDIVRAVAESGRSAEIALYTGNDDNILIDLLTEFAVDVDGETVRTQFVGGLLGQTAVWTRRAVELFERVRTARAGGSVDSELLTVAAQLTDANGAVFDVHNAFAGSVAGIHEVLRRQGLLENLRLLDPEEGLGAGQSAELDRVIATYPDLIDDDFVRAGLPRWMAG